MYGCRRSPNRKLNHTNLICGRGNQITCFGCSADDEFIFVTKLSWQRKKGVGETAYVLCNKASAGGGRWCHWVSVAVSRGDRSCQDLQNTNNKAVLFSVIIFNSSLWTATNVSSLQRLHLPFGGFWLRGLKESRVWVGFLFFYFATAEQLVCSAPGPWALFGFAELNCS